VYQPPTLGLKEIDLPKMCEIDTKRRETHALRAILLINKNYPRYQPPKLREKKIDKKRVAVIHGIFSV